MNALSTKAREKEIVSFNTTIRKVARSPQNFELDFDRDAETQASSKCGHYSGRPLQNYALKNSTNHGVTGKKLIVPQNQLKGVSNLG